MWPTSFKKYAYEKGYSYIYVQKKEKTCASAGNRTRIYCLEGNNANLYTTDASWEKLK